MPPKLSPEQLAELRRITAAQHEVRAAAHAACDRLPPHRQAAIHQAIADGDPSILAALTDPLEIHLFVSSWNADGGASPLLEVIRHPHCDAGTAPWLYWDNDPAFYQQLGTAEEADDDETRTLLLLSRTAEDRFLRDDYSTSLIPFDPTLWFGDGHSHASVNAHTIPRIMRRPLPHPQIHR